MHMAADTIEIVLEPHAFERANSGAITGPIWLRHDQVDFPEPGWRDFPVIVLSWWLKHLTGLAHGTRQAVCSFMDGPFEFSIASEGGSLLRLQFIERGIAAKTSVAEFTIATSALHATLQVSVAATLSECDRRGWTNSDGEYEATVCIESGEVNGHLPKRALAHVHEWRLLHREELLQSWALAQAQQPLPKIAPLE